MVAPAISALLWFNGCTMNRSTFEAAIDDVIEALPQWVVDAVDNLIIVVEHEPSVEQRGDHDDLLGIYEGISLAEREDYWGAMPDQITVFYGPHMRLGLPENELREEIRTTVLHEIGHHLGISDERLHELGWA